MNFRDEVLDDAMAEILRRKTPAERLAIGFELWEFARRTILANLQREHPDWDEAALKREVARRISHGAV